MNEEMRLMNKIDEFPVHSREKFILNRCTGKRVLHLGCTAFPYTKKYLNAGTLLHEKLLSITSSLVGVDNAREGVNSLKDISGMQCIYLLDVYELEKLCEKEKEKFDVILAGEIIEHLVNPGIMLKGVAKLLKDDGVILATVPNAFKYRNFFATQQGVEVVHKDHLSWYSCRTIRRLFEMCDYSDIKIFGYVNGDHWLGRRFLKQSSLFCDGLIIEARCGYGLNNDA